MCIRDRYIIDLNNSKDIYLNKNDNEDKYQINILNDISKIILSLESKKNPTFKELIDSELSLNNNGISFD